MNENNTNITSCEYHVEWTMIVTSEGYKDLYDVCLHPDMKDCCPFARHCNYFRDFSKCPKLKEAKR